MSASTSMNPTITRELLARNDYNVIVVDWSRGRKKLLNLEGKIFFKLIEQVVTQHCTTMQENALDLLEVPLLD